MSLIKKYQNTWISEFLMNQADVFFNEEVKNEAKTLVREN